METKRAGQFFPDYYPSIFAQANIFTPEEFERNLRTFELFYGALMPADKNSRILDIGCGTGQFLHYLSKKGYMNFEGIDLSQSQLEVCRKTFTDRVHNADLFDYLPGVPGAYDLITANDVIEHIPKDKVIDFLTLVHAALRPGGVFLLKCPNMGNPFAGNLRYKDFTHECGFTESSLRQVLYLGGFRNIGIYPTPQEFSFIGSLTVKPFMHLYLRLLTKLLWWQGFVPPAILSPLLIARAARSE